MAWASVLPGNMLFQRDRFSGENDVRRSFPQALEDRLKIEG